MAVINEYSIIGTIASVNQSAHYVLNNCQFDEVGAVPVEGSPAFHRTIVIVHPDHHLAQVVRELLLQGVTINVGCDVSTYLLRGKWIVNGTYDHMVTYYKDGQHYEWDGQEFVPHGSKNELFLFSLPTETIAALRAGYHGLPEEFSDNARFIEKLLHHIAPQQDTDSKGE